MNRRVKSIFIILSLIALITIVLTIYGLWQKKQALRVVKTDPINNAAQIAIDQPVAIYFNRLPKNNEVGFALSPSIDFVQDTIAAENLIVLKHGAYFNTNSRYAVIILNQKQQSIYQFSFNTIASQSNPALIQKVIERQKLDYPLLQYLPYEDENFFIDYSAPVSLYVKIKNPSATREDILQWIKNHGADPASHQIEFAP